jgi:ATP synthase protein I
MKFTKPAKGNHESFARQVSAKELHRLKARREKNKGIWFGLGLLGLIGWSVVIPTLLGLALGIWIDQQFPSSYSWTLMLMLGGLILGCGNALHWVMAEQAKIVGKSSSKELKDD